MILSMSSQEVISGRQLIEKTELFMKRACRVSANPAIKHGVLLLFSEFKNNIQGQ